MENETELLQNSFSQPCRGRMETEEDAWNVLSQSVAIHPDQIQESYIQGSMHRIGMDPLEGPRGPRGRA